MRSFHEEARRRRRRLYSLQVNMIDEIKAKQVEASELKSLREAVFADVCEKRGYHAFEQDFLSDDPPTCECGLIEVMWAPELWRVRSRT